MVLQQRAPAQRLSDSEWVEGITACTSGTVSTYSVTLQTITRTTPTAMTRLRSVDCREHKLDQDTYQPCQKTDILEYRLYFSEQAFPQAMLEETEVAQTCNISNLRRICFESRSHHPIILSRKSV
jgi:hypothetical protein